MKFVHEDPEFDALLAIVARKKGLSIALVEKDYWVSHVLWTLQDVGLDVWFKGGTSLSKGFGLIRRFSEDIDVKIEPGRVGMVPRVENWSSTRKKHVDVRRRYAQALVDAFKIRGAKVTLDATDSEAVRYRQALIEVRYPGRHLGELEGPFQPFVLLEVGDARIAPSTPRTLSSFVHDELDEQGLTREFVNDRPVAVRCVHPLVTMLEKLDALARKARRSDIEPASFVRHIEDCARIALAESALPPLDGYATVRSLAEEMVAERQIEHVPSPSDGILGIDDVERERVIRVANVAIRPAFWGPRLTFEESREAIRDWVLRHFVGRDP